jgi:hypothetical protein
VISPPLRHRLAGLLPLALSIATLAQCVVGFAPLRPLTLALLVAWLAVVIGRTKATERAFLAAAAMSAVAVVATDPDRLATLGAALDRGTAFVALLTALGLLRDAARTSRAVRDCGAWLIAQSPSRRFLAIALGGHGFGIALNMGAVSLLGTMIARANTLEAAGGDAAIVAIREERMNAALLQGFFAMLVWSPLAISVAFTLAMVPSVTWFQMGPPAIALAAAFVATAWLIDRLRWPPSQRRAPPRTGPKPPLSKALPMVAVVASLVASVLTTKGLAGIGMIEAIVWIASLYALCWLGVQYARLGLRHGVAGFRRRLRRHVTRFVPDARGEQIVLGSASFLGGTLAVLLKGLGVSAVLDAAALPGPVLALAIVLFVIVGSQFGIVALVTSAVAGGAVLGMHAAPLSPLELVLALQVGWSLSATLSAYSGGSMLLARIIGRSPDLFRTWNLPWAAACFAIYGAALFALG